MSHSSPPLLLEYKPYFAFCWSLTDISRMYIDNRKETMYEAKQSEYYTCHEYYLFVLFSHVISVQDTFSQQVQYRCMLMDKIQELKQECIETMTYIHSIMMYTFHMPEEISSLIQEFAGPSNRTILACIVEMCTPSVSLLYNAFYGNYLMKRVPSPSSLTNRSNHPSLLSHWPFL